MSHKQNLHAILAKLKAWAEHSGNEELDQHLQELENEINATASAADDEGDTGGNHPTDPPGKP